MPTLSNLPPKPPKILLWGKAGVGKTPFVTSYGKGMLFIDCDDGLLSSRTLKDAWTTTRGEVEIVQCLESDPQKALAWPVIKKTIMDTYNLVIRPKCEIKVLAVDGLTNMAQAALRYVQYNSGVLNNPGTTLKTTTMNKGMWGLAISEISNSMVILKAMPIPVVLVCHAKETTVGDTTMEEMSVFGTNLPGTITSIFDEVIRQKVRTVSGKMEPYLQVVPDAFTVVRTRGNLPDNIKTEIGLRKLLEMLGWK